MSFEKEQHYDQMRANETLLRQTELGMLLADAYIVAISVDSRLTGIEIVPITEPEVTSFAFARPSWIKAGEAGRHEVHVRLSDSDNTLALFKKFIDHSPKAIAIVAEPLGIKPDEVTPELVYVHAAIHEMGHTLDYMDHEGMGKTPEEYLRDHRIESERHHIGKLVACHLVSNNHPYKTYIINNWKAFRQYASIKYSDHVGIPVDISSMDELIDAVVHMHRGSKFETRADQFAAKVLQSHPEIVMRLVGGTTRPQNDLRSVVDRIEV